ncbi:BLUF domain-containing protein [Flammeovirga sp. MY04]|uniref:BLUF domain-containing protein n=1 Tax=Flammeovirga sp. MY04 TaxID=1191459 RepID=UPI000806265B|nr:BLUF domain-containing protein [Flammeovirga sp. MY04]ANQ49230.1 BLUF domain-containing protein [Flammeovirga sp. MY04]
MIYSYIYSSASDENFNEEQLIKLHEAAAKKNKEFDISGYLTFKNDIFIQYIEGPEKSIKQLIENIKKDKRHHIKHDIVLPIREDRLFGDWSMRYIDYNSLIEIGYHELLETIFFSIDNQIFSDEEVIQKINQMLHQIASTMKE